MFILFARCVGTVICDTGSGDGSVVTATDS